MERSDTVRILRAYNSLGREIKMLREMGLPEKEKMEQISLLEQVQQDVSAAMNQLEYVQMDSIWCHYVKGKKWDWVRRKHCYSEKQIRNIANRGLKNVGRTLDGSKAVSLYLRKKRAEHTS